MPEPEISAIVLCYQAREGILKVVTPLYEQLTESQLTFELVLVANFRTGEGDTTPQIVEEFARSRPEAVVVARPKEGGMGWDMRSGLAAATGSYLLVIDGDGQNPVETILELYREMVRTGAAVGKGKRIARYDGTYRRFVSTVYNLLFKLLFRTKGISDVNGKPKGLTRAAYEQMHLESDDWFLDAEITIEALRENMQIVELPVVFRANEERPSFLGFVSILEFMKNLFRARFSGRE